MKVHFALLPVLTFSLLTCLGDERTVKVYTLKDGTVIVADSTATIESDGKTYYIVKPLEEAQPKRSFDGSQLAKVEEKKVPVTGGERTVKVYTLKDGSTIVADHTSTVSSEGITFYVVTPLGDGSKKAQFDSDQLVKVEEKTIVTAGTNAQTQPADGQDDGPVIGRRPGAPDVANVVPKEQPANPPMIAPQAPPPVPPAGGGGTPKNYVEPYTGPGLGIAPESPNNRGYGNGWNQNPYNNYGGSPFLTQPYLPFVPYIPPPPTVTNNSGNTPYVYGGPSNQFSNPSQTTPPMTGGCPSSPSGGSPRNSVPFGGPSNGYSPSQPNNSVPGKQVPHYTPSAPNVANQTPNPAVPSSPVTPNHSIAPSVPVNPVVPKKGVAQNPNPPMSPPPFVQGPYNPVPATPMPSNGSQFVPKGAVPPGNAPRSSVPAPSAPSYSAPKSAPPSYNPPAAAAPKASPPSQSPNYSSGAGGR